MFWDGIIGGRSWGCAAVLSSAPASNVEVGLRVVLPVS